MWRVLLSVLLFFLPVSRLQISDLLDYCVLAFFFFPESLVIGHSTQLNHVVYSGIATE